MTMDAIFEVVKANVLKVLLDVDPGSITMETRLADLGANSVDRVEVAMYSMEDLNLRIPPAEMKGITSLRGLVEVLHRHAGGG